MSIQRADRIRVPGYGCRHDNIVIWVVRHKVRDWFRQRHRDRDPRQPIHVPPNFSLASPVHRPNPVVSERAAKLGEQRRRYQQGVVADDLFQQLAGGSGRGGNCANQNVRVEDDSH
jgi:hypothetical protein